MKKLWIVVVCLLMAIGYMGIVKMNDRIASGLEQALLEYPLPEKTSLVDSKAIAAKLEGNGNGMQYYAAILVVSDLSEDELQAHYAQACPEAEFIFAKKQESQQIFEYQDYWFDNWEIDRPSYRVEAWKYNAASGSEGSLLEGLLNCDIRGH